MAKRKKKNNFLKNIDISMIVTFIILLAIIIGCYIYIGLKFTLAMTAGILVIAGIAMLLEKIKKKKKRRKILNFILILLLLLAIAVCILITSFCIYIMKVSPEFNITNLTKREASILYDANGIEIGKFGKELRENISYDDLPEVFIDALIATEDSRFFQHNGFDAPRFIKASFGQALGQDAGGASTLSMQVIKNNFTDPKQQRDHGIDGIIRKFEDIYLSVFKLEKNFTKEEIIEFYVNNHSLGNNAWGVEQASQTYFGKSVTELNLSEASLLVGLFNNPTRLNPFKYPERAKTRRNTVLNLMVSHGYITREEANIAGSIPVESLLTTKVVTRDYQAYIDTVYNELTAEYGINPNTTSVLVYTNMDRAKQKGIDDVFSGTTYKWVNDVIQSGVSVVDVNTGKIVAVGTGRNTGALQWNYATQTKKQIGSTAKPIFDYGPAIEYLNYSTYEQILDEPWKYSTGQSIENADGKYGGWMSMRQALADSRNIPALKTFQTVSEKVGNKKIVEFATSLGLTPDIASNGTIFEAHSLGAFDGTTPVQLSAAYAAFANGGTYYKPTTINKIVFRENNDVKIIKNEGKKVMSDATAFMITDMLVTSVKSGAAIGIKANNAVIAAKTGTTNFDAATKKRYGLPSNATNDSWVVGYTPDYAIAMWYGYKEINKNYYNKANVSAVERVHLFNALAKSIFSGKKEFTVPKSVEKICVEKGSNPAQLPSQYTPEDQIVCEYFKKGSEPTNVSSAYNKLDAVSNLNVTYNEETQKINITWSKVSRPQDTEAYGDFGYNVYYGDILLGFTQDNSYSMTATSNISGTYKVVTTFSDYTNNQSDPAIFNFTYVKPEPEPVIVPTPTPEPQQDKQNTQTQ